jgi:hypothetical protein
MSEAGSIFWWLLRFSGKRQDATHGPERHPRALGAHVCEPFVIAFDTLKKEGAMVVGGWNYGR